MKFEEIFRSGVIQKGDRLVIAYNRAFSVDFDKELATLTVCCKNLHFPPSSSLR